VGELHPGGLGQAQVQLLLKVFVHHVIIPLQNPQRRKSELTRQKVNSTFLPSAVTNMLCLLVVMVSEAEAIRLLTAIGIETSRSGQAPPSYVFENSP